MKVSNIRFTPGAEERYRIEADVDGEILWFASDDIELTASPEAFASALLIPAAYHGELLEIDAPIDRTWIENVPAIQRQIIDWWRLPGTEVHAAAVVEASRPALGKTAQCFTGGVDSFYELLHAESKPEILVFTHGFDIKLKDTKRLDAFLVGFDQIAATLECTAITVKTNYREHHSLCHVNWERSHGGALAAVGHTLAKSVGRFVIPASYPYHDPHPWGTHWDLDQRWSSSKLTVKHGDATLRRNGKIRAIAGHSLVRHHLRVCWENRAAVGNCSRCEKCIRTMLALEMCGQLKFSKVFDTTVSIDQKIDSLSPLSPHLISAYEEYLSQIDEPRLADAVTRLLSRSTTKGRLWHRIVRSTNNISRGVKLWKG